MSLFKKQSGGFTAKLAALTFEVTEWKEAAKPYATFTAKLVWEKDGAEDQTESYLNCGFIYPKDGQGVSDDGETLEGGAQVAENSEFARFVGSAVEKGIAESELLDDDGNGTNFSALVGYRYEIGREINVERQMAAGKKKLGKKAATSTDDEIMKAGRQQDKKDKTKFYNHTFLVVSSVLGKDEGAAAKGGKANGAAKSKKDEEQDFEAADALLVDLLANAKGKPINKASVSSLIVRKALEDDMDNDTRDSLRKLLSSDEYLKRENGWTFGADEKNQPIALA